MAMIEALKQYDPTAEVYHTPKYAIKPLIPFLNKELVVWECTDSTGKSGITEGLLEAGFVVEHSGKDQHDFLRTVIEGFDMIITNPPYPQKDAFIARCIQYDKPFALLMPLTALEGIKRHKLWKQIEEDFGLMVLDRRVEFTGGGVWFSTAWFTYKIIKGVYFAQLEK